MLRLNSRVSSAHVGLLYTMTLHLQTNGSSYAQNRTNFTENEVRESACGVASCARQAVNALESIGLFGKVSSAYRAR